MEVLKWKTNGKKSLAHLFREQDTQNLTHGATAICGAKIPGFYEVDSRAVWVVKRVTCPKCKARGGAMINRAVNWRPKKGLGPEYTSKNAQLTA